MSARVKLPESLDKLLRSQLEEAIHEAALNMIYSDYGDMLPPP
jgi:hypothetical protein